MRAIAIAHFRSFLEVPIMFSSLWFKMLRAGLAITLLSMGAGSALAMTIDVPGDEPTLQDAVTAIGISPDVDNVITISVSPVVTFSTVFLDDDFNSGRKLVIRPAANLTRASIVNGSPGVPVVEMGNAGYVTLQDLDILRNVTNANHLVSINTSEEILIERCRIGTHLEHRGDSGMGERAHPLPNGSRPAQQHHLRQQGRELRLRD